MQGKSYIKYLVLFLNVISPCCILTSPFSDLRSGIYPFVEAENMQTTSLPTFNFRSAHILLINHLKSEKELSIIFLNWIGGHCFFICDHLPLMAILCTLNLTKKSSDWPGLGQCWHLQQIFEVLILVAKCQRIQSNEGNPGSQQTVCWRKIGNSNNQKPEIRMKGIINKHCEILVSCSDKERNCMQAYLTACKLK